MIVVNLWGGPGAGKSTVANGLLFLLKINLFKAELVPEFAKDLFFEGRPDLIGDQTYIFAEQHRRQGRLLRHGIDFAVSDSPLPLPILYKPKDYPSEIDGLIMAKFNRYKNVNYLLKRAAHMFETTGRWHDERESAAKAVEIEGFLHDNNIPHTVLGASPEVPAIILRDLCRLAGRGDAPLVIPHWEP